MEINPEWEIHPADVKKSLDAKEEMLLLDVRTPREFDTAKIEGATLIPLNELGARAEELAEHKMRRVVVFCHHGRRSLNAAAFLRHHGFQNVLSMAGGTEAWSTLVDPTVPRY